MSDLSKICIRYSPLTKRILLARFGKDPNVALDTREAANDFWQTLCMMAFDGKIPAPGTAVEISFGGGDEQFSCVVTRKVQP